MAWIDIIHPDQAAGLLAKVYDAAKTRAGKVYNILRIQSQNPSALQASMGLYISVMHEDSPLSRARREMLATVVSSTNNCHY
jgi:alkylhydroperoxidase family enzyme